jgi:ssDNA-binding Zn-finger/Zn-ribbon topoisomerase 1
MSLSDTAEYWNDVKGFKPYMPYVGKQYYHIPNAECGRKHWNEAKAIDDVNCTDCLKLIQEGYEHNLPQGKTDFRSNSQKRREAKIEAQRLKAEKLGKCQCGCQRVERVNKQSGTKFLGCSNYPKCNITSSIN